jgi:two-component system chemotaxis response regulator CheB
MDRLVVIGASLSGVTALTDIVAALPGDFAVPILVVLHVGERPSVLPQVLANRSELRASHARHGELLRNGHIHVAPPDHHMLVVDGHIVLSRGPKEHRTRPAIDPLFRSAALSRGADVIGVVLTGLLDNGTAGLQAIKAAGGTAVVQDPEEALAPSMPASALRYVDVDHCVTLPLVPVLLTSLVAEPGRGSVATALRRCFAHEEEVALQEEDPMEHLEAIGSPSTFTCPECHGTLWRILDSRPRRYRCHTGHGFTERTLRDAMAGASDEAMESARRSLQERELLLRDMAEESRATGSVAEATRLDAAAKQLNRQGELLVELLEQGPEPFE